MTNQISNHPRSFITKRHLVAIIVILNYLLASFQLISSNENPLLVSSRTKSLENYDLMKQTYCEHRINDTWPEEAGLGPVILVTGGAGFIGSHLVDRLLNDTGSHDKPRRRVIVMDDLSTGNRSNIQHHCSKPNFKFIKFDIRHPLSLLEVDQIYHLASPASPVDFMRDPLTTIETIALGSRNVLELALATKATVLLASTSEVYGDPLVHPQPETYWGNVNPIGPRASYDESKRLSETMAQAYASQRHLNVTVARIFNTYGPRMRANDGRVIPNFINQALKHENLTIFGKGTQTRCFLHVSDLVTGLIKLMEVTEQMDRSQANQVMPINLGSDEEISVENLAHMISSLMSNSKSQLEFLEARMDDPVRRRPELTRARTLLLWESSVALRQGLTDTIRYFERLG